MEPMGTIKNTNTIILSVVGLKGKEMANELIAQILNITRYS
jgi:hypothetical protein